MANHWQIEAFVTLMDSGSSEEERAAISVSLHRDVQLEAVSLEDFFVLTGRDGDAVAATRLLNVGKGQYVLSPLALPAGSRVGPSEAELIKRAMARAFCLGATRVGSVHPEMSLQKWSIGCVVDHIGRVTLCQPILPTIHADLDTIRSI